MMLLASRSKVMGKFTLPLYLKILGWLATSITAVAAAGMLLTFGKSNVVWFVGRIDDFMGPPDEIHLLIRRSINY
jgi:hypothetical protein